MEQFRDDDAWTYPGQLTGSPIDAWAARAPTALATQVGGDHYKSLAIQPIEYITKNNLGWCEGNIVKYITRWKQKGGHADIDKVIHYANLLKELNDTKRN